MYVHNHLETQKSISTLYHYWGTTLAKLREHIVRYPRPEGRGLRTWT